jgi:hypothetical protein
MFRKSLASQGTGTDERGKNTPRWRTVTTCTVASDRNPYFGDPFAA